MKLAEALLERKSLMAKIKELHGKFEHAAVHEEGDKPEGDAKHILAAMSADFGRYRELVVAINKTNNKIPVGDGTMMEAIALRDVLKWSHDHYKGLADVIRNRNANGGYFKDSAPKKVVADGLDIATVTKLADEAAKSLREIDAEIQAANWANDLQ